MSVIACRVLDDGYEMASDSITVRGWTQSKGDNKSHSKLIETNGIVIGAVGTCEESSLLHLFASTRKPALGSELSLLEWMSEFSEWKDKKCGEKGIKNTYLIGLERQVFSVEGWFITQVTKYEAIGAGMDFALAAMYMGNSAKGAVKAACELSIFCEEPIQVITKGVEK